MTESRAQHVALCKAHALEYLDAGDVVNAVASMTSDLGKHPDTAMVGAATARIGLLYAIDRNVAGCRRRIEGFS